MSPLSFYLSLLVSFLCSWPPHHHRTVVVVICFLNRMGGAACRCEWVLNEEA
ncbi:hypothetical protein Hanom_Chr14g01276831 [Helianthus anomalus]